MHMGTLYTCNEKGDKDSTSCAKRKTSRLSYYSRNTYRDVTASPACEEARIIRFDKVISLIEAQVDVAI
jgi:hypothetical protein